MAVIENVFRRTRGISAIALLLACIITGCGGGGGGSAPGSSGNSYVPVPAASPTSIAKIAVIAPLNSGLTAFGRGILNSVQLAVAQANAANKIPGFRLVVVPLDDASTPATGAAAAKQAAADPLVIGVIGTYNSGVAAQVAPILKTAGMVEISPANTDPTLTLGPDPKQPVRPYFNYFRMVVPDSIQGPALARFAFQTLGVRNVAVVTESKSVSQGLANDFSSTFTGFGGTITTTEVVPAGTTDYSAILARVAATRPQLLFYGGEYDTGITVRTQARAAGISAPMMGGDGLKDDAYIAGTGAASEGDLASTVGAPPAKQPGGPAFLQAYKAAGFTDSPTDYGPFAYDAANTLITAAAAVLGAHPSIDGFTRLGIISSVQRASLTGVTGPIGFDAFGDTTHKVLTVYQVVGGQWVAQQTLTL